MKSNRWIAAAAAVASCLTLFPAHAQNADTQAFQDLKSYDFEHRKPVATVQHLIQASLNDKARLLDIENNLDADLNDPATTLGAKLAIGRMLWEIGTAQSVPSLAAMLPDEKLVNVGIYGLERNPDLSAGKALRDALGKTNGLALVAVINAVGDRRDPAAVSALKPLASAGDPTVASSAIAALGKIGTADSIAALQSLPAHTLVIDQALINDADRAAKEGHVNVAVPVYRQFVQDPNSPQPIRISAQYSALMTGGTASVGQAMSLLRGPDTDLRDVAIRYLHDAPANSDFTAVVQGMDQLPPASQALLLHTLSDRGDRAALPVLLQAVRSTDPQIRLAALQGFSTVEGNADAVNVLAALAGKEGEDPAVRDAARGGLSQMRGVAVDQAVLNAIPTAPSATKAELILSLRQRGVTTASPMLFRLAQSPDQRVQAAAFTALTDMGTTADYAGAVHLLLHSATDSERTGAESLVTNLAKLVPPGQDRTSELIAGYRTGSPATKTAVLTVLPALGGDPGLALVKTALKSPDAATQDEAVRALSAWPDQSALPDITSIARTDTNLAHQVLALRGYTRLVGLSDRPAAEKLQMLHDAMAMAHRPEERKLVLSGIANVNDPAALKSLVGYMDDENLREEAAAAAVSSGEMLGGLAGPDLKPDMQKVIDTSKSPDTVRRARAVLSLADTMSRGWRVLGPFPAGKEGFDKDFGPEAKLDFGHSYPVAGGVLLHWKAMPAEKNGYMNLLNQFQPNQDVVAYAAVYIKSPDARQAIFSMGSDDGIKAWLNGNLVAADNAVRPANPGDVKAKVNLKAGWNTVLLKITQSAGEWGYYFDVLKTDQQPMTDIDYSSVPQD